jgi:hypothetical protein
MALLLLNLPCAETKKEKHSSATHNTGGVISSKRFCATQRSKEKIRSFQVKCPNQISIEMVLVSAKYLIIF